MRRLLLAAAISAVVLGAAGCSTDAPTPAGTPAPAPGGASTAVTASVDVAAAKPGGAGTGKNAGDAALSGNTSAICNQATKTGGDFAATFAQDLKLLVDAESSQDKNLAAKAKQKTGRDVENYSFALGDLSRLAADPTVKNALGTMAKQVTALKGDVRKLDDSKLDALRTTLDRACGKG
jgi:hypothetical protein